MPAACRTSRSGGPGSGAAGSGAHDSSGLRWLPSTPAPPILVVLVITDGCPAVDGGLPPGDPQPLMTVMKTAVKMAVAEAIRPTRGPLISTPPTVTSGLFGVGQAAN